MTITAKFAGRCRRCGGEIQVGDQIEWSREEGARHLECPTGQGVEANNAASYRLSGGSGYGCEGWEEAEVIATDRRYRGRENWPDYLVVVRAGRRYVREDGMSFGVGDEAGYVYWAECRAASEQEAAPLIAAREIKQQRTEAAKRAKALAKDVCKRGERPERNGDGSQLVIDGEQLLDCQNVYGGGDWWVVQPAAIWYVLNNGRDGDDWSQNNVRTGGAGAIGWRVPYDEALAQELRVLNALLIRQPA